MRFPDFNDDWKETTLGEIAGLVQTRRKATTRYLSVESFLPNFGGVQFAHNETNNSGVAFEVDDVLMSNIRPYLRKVWRSNCSGACSSDVLVFRCGTQVISQFLYSIIANQAFIDHTMQGAKGVKMPRGDKQQMKSYPISLPSLAEQKKIADFLSLIDERIQSCSETIKELKTQKAGLLNQLFSQKLRFPDFDDEWRVTTLGEIGETYTGLSGKSSENFGKGSPYITYKMVYDGVKINLCNTEYVYVSESEKQNQVRLGDILFTTSSETPEETGLCSVLLSSSDELYLNSFCFGYRLNEESLATSIFLGYALRSPIYRIKLSTLAQGSTRYNISKSEVMRMPISLPSLAEQKKIADFLSLIDERIEVEEQLLQQYEKQKRYLLKQMFV